MALALLAAGAFTVGGLTGQPPKPTKAMGTNTGGPGATRCTSRTSASLDWPTLASTIKRQAVNTWIRTSGEYDGVIDFDRVLRDPNSPSKILAVYDSGDHGHPTDAGYQALATAIDLRLFTNGEGRQ
jgi:hypothetical protein